MGDGLVTGVSLKSQFEHIQKQQISLRCWSTARWELLIRFVSLVFVSGAFMCGGLGASSIWTLSFLILAGAYQILRLYFYVWGTFVWRKRVNELPANPPDDQLPMITVLVPCFNEEKVIAQSLRSLMALDYPNFEIVVIDDGSSDHTFKIAKTFETNSKVPLLALTKKNSGKADSINTGLMVARGEYVLCVDADCIVEKSSLRKGIRHMLADPNVVAVAGTVRVENRKHFITAYQELEYGLGDLQKASLANFGCVNVVPGPAGLFRIQALIDAGGYEVLDTTFAEDTEITLRLIALKGRVTFEPEMTSSTEAPDNWHSLVRQRYRWTRGVYQALRKNAEALTNRQHFLFALYLFMENIWTPVMDFALLAYFVGFLVAHASFDPLIMYGAFILISELSVVFLARWYSHRPAFLNMAMLCLSRYTFSIVIATWKFLSLLEEWNQVGMSWDKLHRRGMASVEEGEVVC